MASHVASFVGLGLGLAGLRLKLGLASQASRVYSISHTAGLANRVYSIGHNYIESVYTHG